MLRYRQIKSHFFTDTFFVTKKAKSTKRHTCMLIFFFDKVFVKVYPMKLQREFSAALRQFAKGVRASEILVFDPHPSQKRF